MDRIFKYPVPITPSDSANVSPSILRFKVGVAGNVAIQPLSGANVVYVVPAGGTIEMKAQKVLATGTTANNIIGEY
ncbi:hypothetical protein [Caulobacter phage Cr30]|uniref:hypothetical protein n=1 Tax=Caulobacter phage Cr30 TaxID=1357714 RepID=UPI0004A9BAD1|nr:hypothetical protein OZ74_gp270 [Caulobacter phage Cr30]AGS81073.1 hypothetical protein [Caulobacter phage Cr30]